MNVQYFLWQCQSEHPIPKADVGTDTKTQAEILLK